MIGALRGKLIGISDQDALIDINGVGYLVGMGSAMLGRLKPDQEVLLHIETRMSENAIKLYGFLEEDQRSWFNHLTQIPGVGAKAGMAILDVLSPDEIMDAVALEDVDRFTRANGVGKKLAARIAGELKGKTPPSGFFSLNENIHLSNKLTEKSGENTQYSGTKGANLAQMGSNQIRKEAISALTNLGYAQSEAVQAVALALQEGDTNAGLDQIIKTALRELAR